MVNVYCDQEPELGTLFGMLVLMGILEEKDAQCFRVETAVESPFFFLASGALVLAFLNTFVKKAACQYVRDVDERCVPKFQSPTVEQQMNVDLAKDLLDPLPVLFSDRFRWFLVRNESRREYLQVFSTSSLERPADESTLEADANNGRSAENITVNQSISPESSHSSGEQEETPAAEETLLSPEFLASDALGATASGESDQLRRAKKDDHGN